MGFNEKKTENLVRLELEKFGYYKDKNIVVEEQKSDNLKINKLLEHASKKGLGRGFPEFIIRHKTKADFLIVIECKADIKKHESKNHNKYSEYAVDGVLLYASFLSKEYDVLAIAVSGENKSELKISHFIQLKETDEKARVFGNNLLNFTDYYEHHINREEKLNQDFNKLLAYSCKLNDSLHSLKVKESDRSLLISGILIGLKHKPFLKGYKDYTSPSNLSKALTQAIGQKMKDSGLNEDKLSSLNRAFNFITTHNILSKKESVLIDLISEVDKEINSFMTTHEYHDVLGQFYVEFLRYANNDKGLGIVLTPSHITTLFSELANLNKGSKVIDPCAGTGGFLIGAMNKMIKEAQSDSQKIKEIKRNQIFGIEIQDTIFSLACSNMFIHDDGKSQLIEGDCFDDSIKEQLKEKKFDFGLLNPPYKSNPQDKDEFEFVINTLDLLRKGGECIAIVPISCASKLKRLDHLKQKIMDNHTLEAVLSMPKDLFTDATAGVETCVIIIKAHFPHPENKKTWFSLCRDDGFVKTKKNRIDKYNKWPEIRKKWVESYMNKEELTGFSICKKVTYKDEWCAENYLKTDLKKIKKESFIRNLKSFCAYRFEHNLVSEIKPNSILKDEIEINIKNMKPFPVTEFFDVYTGKDKLKLEILDVGKEINIVENQTINNGVSEKVFVPDSTKEIFNNFITVASQGAKNGKAYFQKEDAVGVARVKSLVPRDNYKQIFDPYILLFICTIIDQESFRYGFGRGISSQRMKDTILHLPSKDDKPDWNFMRKFIKCLPHSSNL